MALLSFLLSKLPWGLARVGGGEVWEETQQQGYGRGESPFQVAELKHMLLGPKAISTSLYSPWLFTQAIS